MTFAVHLGDCLETLRRMPDASVDSLVCDPPYGLSREPDVAEVLRHWLAGDDYLHTSNGFMGKAWDSFVPGPAIWREAFRVLKPGGHLVAFTSTRTEHLLGIALALAGFHRRDTLHWAYFQGFNHGSSVSKQMDRKRHDRDQILQVTAWIREARDARGLRNTDLNDAFGFRGMAGHWTSAASQPAIPTLDQVPRLLEVLGEPEVPEEIRRLLVELNGAKGEPGEAWHQREIVGHRAWSGPDARDTRPGFAGLAQKGEIAGRIPIAVTKGGTAQSQLWDGWGTTLKPSIEPAILCRKPMIGTVADNVARYGTGALNIGGCRFDRGDAAWLGPQDEPGGVTKCAWLARGVPCEGHPDERSQSGRTVHVAPIDDADARGAANLYHEPKATRRERERGIEHLPPASPKGWRNAHPTVKPVRLLRWLCRLVTPPGGGIVDPFMGSGSCGVAALLEGFRYDGCELEPGYVTLAEARIRHAAEHPEAWADTAPGARKRKAPKAPQASPARAGVVIPLTPRRAPPAPGAPQLALFG